MLPFPEKISVFHPPKFLMTLLLSHRPQILNFPSYFACFSSFPPLIGENYYVPLLSQISPLFSENSPAFYILCVYISPPTLTMMHLCITQCTYWTPLERAEMRMLRWIL